MQGRAGGGRGRPAGDRCGPGEVYRRAGQATEKVGRLFPAGEASAGGGERVAGVEQRRPRCLLCMAEHGHVNKCTQEWWQRWLSQHAYAESSQQRTCHWSSCRSALAARPPSLDQSPAPSARLPLQIALRAQGRHRAAGQTGRAVGHGGRSPAAAGPGAARQSRGSLGAVPACQIPGNLAREAGPACRSLCGHATPFWGPDRLRQTLSPKPNASPDIEGRLQHGKTQLGSTRAQEARCSRGPTLMERQSFATGNANTDGGIVLGPTRLLLPLPPPLPDVTAMLAALRSLVPFLEVFREVKHIMKVPQPHAMCMSNAGMVL